VSLLEKAYLTDIDYSFIQLIYHQDAPEIFRRDECSKNHTDCDKGCAPVEFIQATEKLDNQEDINHPNTMAITKERQQILTIGLVRL
jgi:hypothetical protein